MSITSFSFFILIILGVIIYYLLPKSWQWIELLIMSLIFYFMAATPGTIICLFISTATAYIATNFSLYMKNDKPGVKRTAMILSVLAVLINIGLWFFFKAGELWKPLVSGISMIVPAFGKVGEYTPVAALGMGYYTLQIIGYILDCYWDNVKPQKNPLKLFLFVCFFPQMTTGPISRYSQLACLYEKHTLSYRNISFGAQRILWGLLKKIVLAERAGIIVNGIWNQLDTYNGYYRWIALLLFPIQMYADFSGCMDIVLGTAELFGIRLPENFNSPFFSRTVQEFWQRWHITLGTWAKDYVLYPLLKSRLMVNFSKKAKKRLGKKYGKFVATVVGMFTLWMVMGIWHGAPKYIVGVSLWYWILLMLGELCSPWAKKLSALLKIPEDSFSWHLVQSVRTYLIYAVGAAFFRAPSIGEGFGFVLSLGGIFKKEIRNPWIFFDGSILNLGITHQDINIMIIAVCMLLIVGFLREKHGYARIWLSRQLIVFRWMIWIGLFVFVLIYGKYGPGYAVEEFIYQGF